METKRDIHTIDAANKVLGRLSTEIAILLRGKHKPDFAPYKEGEDFVRIINASKLKLTGKKAAKKFYYRHSGYMGGLKSISLKELFEKDPARVLRKAVYGMLPTNKLRDKMIKRLIIEP
ncbi:MAG: 50S ribosomal protein L13 [Parcubacteria group bacterium CG11_big_fil_rev_8_21_14_0_20_39_14]|nr:MAG: 50S ribosomal protein L13 [Parcubacteria group bacterium CG11_big_fil_rev_8_21_14_0_20_39_14]PIS35034.1 MAG: 50S ribosomal protein L13 [Parcubacteria group bacterium CG08_land_8_20_14_0_20_38_56]